MLEIIVHAPFIRLFVAFSIGIAIRLMFIIPQPITILLLLLTFVIAIGLMTLNKISGNYRLRWLFGFNLHLLLIVFGIYVTQQKLFTFKNGLKINGSSLEMIGRVSEPPECRTKSVKCCYEVDQVKDSLHFRKTKEKILVYFHKDAASVNIKAGDVILLKTSPAEVDISGNPYEFNFRRYLAFKGIRFTAYTDSCNWKCISHNELPLLILIADNLRLKLLGIFSGLGMTGDELAVASSLVIGDQSGLDDEIKRAYTTSGTMHILAD